MQLTAPSATGGKNIILLQEMCRAVFKTQDVIRGLVCTITLLKPLILDPGFEVLKVADLVGTHQYVEGTYSFHHQGRT
jgi:hypothetical protein